ncbi:Gfo/Idh/MocA family protein [Streptomyces cavernicola]|uniref:Gfo/Idh/MocA family oxidoreductase n=1 Tax=Streptomyces cavernicola TaxID=3043613 RepID=A0ABT6SJ26_9ACTN|nr:Gfo/Idh/MocA family oxidoreductase [Streptomyces sp. B-S-A6]MDI3408201.1 Gfo/Idh/MocA family oxidoreductase [Streptomyces sp. B-S-A6]
MPGLGGGTAVSGPVRIGVLGCADIARRRMLPAMAASPEVTLAAVASRDAARARRTAQDFGCAAVHGYEALLRRDDIDAVYLPLPAALHAEWAGAALDAGKHVLAEKPLTTRAASTRELVARAGRAGLALMENVMFVHHAQHAAVRALLDDGALGELRAFQAAFAVPRRPDGDIRLDPALGGGALWDTGVYPVRAALHLLNEPLSVAGAVLARGRGDQVDTSGTALLRTAGGVAVQLSFGLDHSYRSAYEIWGSQGRLTVEPAFTPPAGHAPRIVLQRQGGTEEFVLDPDDQVRHTVEAFAAAVRSGAPADPACVEQADLLDAIREAAAGGPRGGARHG